MKINTDLASEHGPFGVFRTWLADAEKEEVNDPHAMNLSTFDPVSQRVSSRMVTLRGFDESGFIFFTNKNSPKDSDLSRFSQCALTFHWKSCRTQIRIEGSAAPLGFEELENFFLSKSHDAQLTSYLSRKQSRPLASTELLHEELASLRNEFSDGLIPGVETVSGYRIGPDMMEFWASERSRLHNRFIYRRDEDGWSRDLLYP